MTRFIRSPRLWTYVALTAILAAGFYWWQWDLTADPPFDYDTSGQSLSTDPYMYVYHARNRILFGETNPFGDQRWVVFEKSIVSLAAFWWMSARGVSMRQANMVGILLSFGGLLLMLGGVIRHHPPWVVLLIAAGYLANLSLYVYGRLPYLENGLIFWAGLLFLVYSRWHDRLAGQIACGAIIACAALTGKLLGLFLLPTVLLTTFHSSLSHRIRLAVGCVSGWITGTGLIIGVLYGAEFPSALTFYRTVAHETQGSLVALTSPLKLIESFAGYGFVNALFTATPELGGFAIICAALLLFMIGGAGNRPFQQSPVTIRFCVYWITFGWLGLMLQNYSPLRYALYIIPAVIILTVLLLQHRLSQPTTIRPGRRISFLVMAGLLSYVIITQVVLHFFFRESSRQIIGTVTWPSLGAAIVIVAMLFLLGKRVRIHINRQLVLLLIMLMPVTSITVNAYQTQQRRIFPRYYNIRSANADLRRIVGRDAVVAGSYAQPVTINTDLRSLIHFFGRTAEDSLLTTKFPVTHVAIDIANWKRAAGSAHELASILPIATYWIRGREVKLYPISEITHNQTAGSYRPTVFEQAVRQWQHGHADSAWSILQRAPQIITDTKAGGQLFAELAIALGDMQAARRMYKRLASRYPTDYRIQLRCGSFLQQLALAGRDNALLQRARQYFETATLLNLAEAKYIRQRWEMGMRSRGH